LIVGGKDDSDLANRLQLELGNSAVTFAGETTLRQTASLLSHVRLIVANDSGPMHLAAAAGVAVLEISCHPVGGDPKHAHSPVRFHPWTTEYAVAQPNNALLPCDSHCEWHEPHCILGVSVNSVHEMAQKLLRQRFGDDDIG
jgi:heptosyltransferase-2